MTIAILQRGDERVSLKLILRLELTDDGASRNIVTPASLSGFGV
jgi:hypothetical protein